MRNDIANKHIGYNFFLEHFKKKKKKKQNDNPLSALLSQTLIHSHVHDPQLSQEHKLFVLGFQKGARNESKDEGE